MFRFRLRYWESSFILCAIHYFGTIIIPSGAVNVTIVDLTVPSVDKASPNESLILDCVYVTTDLEKGRSSTKLVKWYRNNDLIYQWTNDPKLQGQNPMVKAKWEKLIDRSYTVEDEGNVQHRPLAFRNKTVDLSGTYECKVELWAGANSVEDSKAKKMTIYSFPEELMTLGGNLTENDSVLNIICSAENIIPKPSMTIHTTNTGLNRVEVQTNIIAKSDSYDVSSSMSVDKELLQNGDGDVEVDLGTVFNCTLVIPEVNVVKSLLVKYQDGDVQKVEDEPLELKNEDQSSGNGGNSLSSYLIAATIASFFVVGNGLQLWPNEWIVIL